jgi:dCMP deaminase
VSLDQFVEIHDKLHYGPSTPSTSSATTSMSSSAMTDFSRVMSLATVKVDNCFPTIEGLWTYLDTLNLLDEERLRPGWDTYFMVSPFHPTLEGANARHWHRWHHIGQIV